MRTPPEFYFFLLMIISYCSGAEYVTRNVGNIEKNTKQNDGSNHNNIRASENIKYFASIIVSTIHLCTGVYVKPLWIITAAQCISIYPVTDYEIFMGTSKANGQRGEVRKAEKVFPHQKFGQVSVSFDIGLIKLDKAFAMADEIGTLTMAQELVYEDNCNIFGWGLSLIEGATLPNDAGIETTELPIVETQKCSQFFKTDDVQVDSSHVCAGSNIDICMADAGSALICSAKMVGIASAAADCGSRMPSLFTSVPFYYRWIENTIINDDPDSFNNASCLLVGKLLLSLYVVSLLGLFVFK